MDTVNVSRRAWMLMLAAAFVVPVGLTTTVRADDESDREKAMEKINTAYKLLRRTARRGNYDAKSEAQAQDIHDWSIKSKDVKVPEIEKLPDAKREAAYKAYKKLLDKQAKVGKDLLAAIKSKDKDKAKELIDELGKIKKEGHDKFAPDA